MPYSSVSSIYAIIPNIRNSSIRKIKALLLNNSIYQQRKEHIGMKVEEIKELAKQQGINPRKMKKADIIRAIQAEEGNPQCFSNGEKDKCGQESCLWQEDCD